MGDRSIKRRQRQPRVDDNPMALLAQRVMAEAKDAFRTADDLAVAMEPHLLQQVSNSAIYQYTAPGSERKRNVPPGDVLLAAALAAGLSLDEKLGLVRQANDIEILRAQLAEMREEMASLRAVVTGGGTHVDRVAAADVATARVNRAAQRQAWAQRSRADAGPQGEPGPSTRRARRAAGR